MILVMSSCLNAPFLKRFPVHTKTQSRRYQIPPVEELFRKAPLSWRANVDIMSNRRNKGAFSNSCGVVWTLPKTADTQASDCSRAPVSGGSAVIEVTKLYFPGTHSQLTVLNDFPFFVQQFEMNATSNVSNAFLIIIAWSMHCPPRLYASTQTVFANVCCSVLPRARAFLCFLFATEI